MKILLINNFYPPISRGGTEQVVESLAEKLMREENEVVIATLEFPISPPKAGPPREDNFQLPKNEKHRVIRIPDRNIYHPLNDYKHNVVTRLVWWLIMIFNPFVARDIKRIIQEEKPDLVWTHNLYGLSFLIPRVIKKLCVKHRHTVHDIQLMYPSGVLIKGEEGKWMNTIFFRKWYEWLTQRLFSSPDEVIFPSAWLKGFYEERGFFRASQCVVESNFSTPNFRFQIPDLKLKNPELGMQMLYVGQIERHKGILFLISALKTLHALPYTLSIVGNGAALDEAKGLAAEDTRITFHGHIEHNRIDGVYQQADLVIVPSLAYENAPTVIFEALGHKVPVLASDIGGIPELIADGKSGWLIETGNQDDFIAKIKQINNFYKRI